MKYSNIILNLHNTYFSDERLLLNLVHILGDTKNFTSQHYLAIYITLLIKHEPKKNAILTSIPLDDRIDVLLSDSRKFCIKITQTHSDILLTVDRNQFLIYLQV